MWRTALHLSQAIARLVCTRATGHLMVHLFTQDLGQDGLCSKIQNVQTRLGLFMTQQEKLKM